MSSQCKPKLSDLRLTELRTELENRELDAAGKKADLVVRLKIALQEEGHDPETSVFEDRQTALISSISKEISQVSTDITSANGWSEKDKAVNLVIALRGEALDVLQTIAVEETNYFEQLMKRLNMRYGHEHLEYVYQARLKNRRQKKDEALQEYELDIARLV
ncbi:uncharacterized protein LOC126890087 [Diabrotica virgifera virgifera]|uniref:SAP domain-containing protein n=1 Tax=Diabrotica virgifera virgifera TaxID=50390 RepID=A0ABM5KXH1_DIAVI|nr:uncharacterized protein LOC126890087 [Diabrotica virgifera virgifera]